MAIASVCLVRTVLHGVPSYNLSFSYISKVLFYDLCIILKVPPSLLGIYCNSPHFMITSCAWNVRFLWGHFMTIAEW